MKFMFFLTFIFLPLLVNAKAADTIEAKEIDISDFYECNDLFCPNDSISPAERQLQERVGYTPPSMPTDQFTVRPVKLSLKSGAIAAAIRDIRNGGVRDVSENATPVDVDDDNGDGDESTGPQNGQAGQPGFGGFNPNNPNVSPASVPIGTDPTNPNVKSGFLYRPDEKNTNEVSTPEASPGANPNLAGLAGNPASAVSLNKGNDSDDSGGKTAAAGFGGSGSSLGALSGNHGDFESGGSGAPAPARNGYLDQLASIASRMGESFFGAMGGGKGGSGSDTEYALAGKKGRNPASSNGQIASNEEMRKLLQSRMGRSFASQLEFAGKNTSMFGRMCNHYINYARKNGIPNDNGPCPDN